MAKVKNGVYMGPTGELFVLIPTEETIDLRVPSGNSHVLINNHDEKDPSDIGSYFPGGLDEFERMLAGFEYLGRL